MENLLTNEFRRPQPNGLATLRVYGHETLGGRRDITKKTNGSFRKQNALRHLLRCAIEAGVGPAEIGVGKIIPSRDNNMMQE